MLAQVLEVYFKKMPFGIDFARYSVVKNLMR